MTRDEIITNLFLGENFNKCIRKMEPDHLRDDLKSEVMLILCEMPAEKIQGLHERKELEFYTVRIILNLIKSDTSPFAKTFRQSYLPIAFGSAQKRIDIGERAQIVEVVQLHTYQDKDTIEDRELKELIEDTAIAEIDNLYWYDKEMILMYKRLGNFRAIEAETGIPFISCYKNIKKSLERLKNKAVGENKTIFCREELKQIQDK